MSNITTSDPQPFTPRAEYLIIPFLAILGLLLALAICIRRRQRNDALRHRLIPLISYSQTKQESESEEDGDEDDPDEDDLEEPLRSDDLAFDGRLLFHSSSDQ
ncbi:small integral membrane protein 29-like [Anguilla anguilla]|uniref:small integral membrane protein 29-like n=1 Tax=Anguilla anguilla TaxID=7936 RepID=UPI0015B02019|nr:small integral membrane protein 29-like [Anguilla anguilla]XP_035282689.1 small integral membrane protein 29-like [Anguilla anguilla]